MKSRTLLNGKHLRNERGQSLVLAIIVMFLLVLVGTVFVLLVAGNQARAGGSKDREVAQYLAEAGVQYADKMLKTSELGADWRPAPDELPVTAQNDPDYDWLKKYDPTTGQGGFSRFNMGDGRFLIRVSYNPDSEDPMGKFIKIESIGRMGTVDPDDPTTFEGNRRLRTELTAYKPIGLTDYARFITNKEKRPIDLALGAPGFNVKYGSAAEQRGAPIRVNGDLKWYGDKVEVFLRGKTFTAQQLPIDTVSVAGKIDQERDASGNPMGSVLIRRILNGVATNDDTADKAYTTDSGSFTTFGGFYRDGSGSTDAGGNARTIKRIDPPIIDSNDTPTKTPRYLALTRDSGIWVSDGTRMVNTGRFGWGKGVYIDNSADLQPESEVITGLYTQRGDWMKPYNYSAAGKAFWHGPYYVPPGVVIVLNPIDTDGDGKPDITITRTDFGRNGRRMVQKDPTGKTVPGDLSTYTIPYPQGPLTLNYTDASGDPQTKTIEQNGVIYADGNIRIRGMMAPNKQLTIVSGGTIYIEGNLLKNRDVTTGAVDSKDALALLAHDYVCVNTTQFVGLMTPTTPNSFESDAGTATPPFHMVITPEPSSSFLAQFSFGPRTGAAIAPKLFTRHAGIYGAAYINMFLNGASINISTWLGNGLNSVSYGVGDDMYSGQFAGTGSTPGFFEHRVWDLTRLPADLPANLLNQAVGYTNQWEIALDQSSQLGNTRANYGLGVFAIQPMDIRIEAIMYAQERSFFIIPGMWFNMDPSDIPGKPGRPGVDPMWPFFGQAPDIKITIDGAITENTPASASDVSEWYSKWSNIPAVYGSSTVPTAHPGDGLTFLYDPMMGYPKDGATPIREDIYHRALPATPCLPVCESLIYYGQTM